MTETSKVFHPNPTESETKVYGKSVIAQLLVNIGFPCNKQELIRLIGHKEVEYRRGYLIKFRDAIKPCFSSQHTFSSSEDVISCISTYLDSMGFSERSVNFR